MENYLNKHKKSVKEGGRTRHSLTAIRAPKERASYALGHPLQKRIIQKKPERQETLPGQFLRSRTKLSQTKEGG